MEKSNLKISNTGPLIEIIKKISMIKKITQAGTANKKNESNKYWIKSCGCYNENASP